MRRHLAQLQGTILSGAHVVFSHVIPLGFPDPEQHPAWRLATKVLRFCGSALGASAVRSLNHKCGAAGCNLQPERWAAGHALGRRSLAPACVTILVSCPRIQNDEQAHPTRTRCGGRACTTSQHWRPAGCTRAVSHCIVLALESSYFGFRAFEVSYLSICDAEFLWRRLDEEGFRIGEVEEQHVLPTLDSELDLANAIASAGGGRGDVDVE